MSKFADSKNREWSIEITTGTIKRVRNEFQLDLADPGQAALEKLAADPVLLVDLLWLLCAEDGKRRDVSAEEFGRSLVGDAIEAATAALLEGVADFFPSRMKSLLRDANQKQQTVRQRAFELARAKLADPSLDEALEQAMQERMAVEMQNALTRLRSPTSSPGPPAG